MIENKEDMDEKMESLSKNEYQDLNFYNDQNHLSKASFDNHQYDGDAV